MWLFNYRGILVFLACIDFLFTVQYLKQTTQKFTSFTCPVFPLVKQKKHFSEQNAPWHPMSSRRLVSGEHQWDVDQSWPSVQDVPLNLDRQNPTLRKHEEKNTESIPFGACSYMCVMNITRKIHFVGHVSEIFGIFWRFSPFWILFVFFEGFDPGGKIQPRHNPRHQRCLHPSHLCVQSWWPRRTQICSCWQFAETHLWFSQEPNLETTKMGETNEIVLLLPLNPQQNFQQCNLHQTNFRISWIQHQISSCHERVIRERMMIHNPW